MQPQRIFGVLLLVTGVVLLVMGIRATDSFASQFSKFFTSSPTDQAVWLTLGGALAILIGAAAALRTCRACGPSPA